METCIVIEHLPRLSASQNRNGITEENGDISPEKRKAFGSKVTIIVKLQHNLKFIDLTYYIQCLKCLCLEIYIKLLVH